MAAYTKDDLQILTDAVALIRGNPKMYLGADEATGEHLAAQMMSTLIWLGALPAKVSKHGPWWVVSSDDDWLVKSGHADVKVAFSRIVPLSGLINSHRSEVLLSAFADAVVTSGTDGTRWVSGDSAHFALPKDVELAHSRGGRTVAFRLERSADH